MKALGGGHRNAAVHDIVKTDFQGDWNSMYYYDPDKKGTYPFRNLFFTAGDVCIGLTATEAQQVSLFFSSRRERFGSSLFSRFAHACCPSIHVTMLTCW